jgi:hypothetical protein
MCNKIREDQHRILAYQMYLYRLNDPYLRHASKEFDWHQAGQAMNYFENPYKTEWSSLNEVEFGDFRKFLTKEYKNYIKKINKSWEFDCNSNQWIKK